ncbi:glycosyltransferase family 2 protein [Variovorax boronicumulans]|uniref:glycosyltransferase family 2 protein n=1 Tax=Variovorax boronicumulans TaxID=436515 RepID=UPI0033918AFC
MPALTVVLPTYNGERYLAETIEAILGQSFEDFELLVLDDGSTDGSLDIAHGFRDARVKVHRNDLNLGLPTNMNIGVARARGPFLARVDQDDLPRADRFAQQIEFLRAHEDITVVGSQVEHFGAMEVSVSEMPLTDDKIKARFVSGVSYFANQASMGRVGFYRQHRLQFDANLYVMDDLGFWFDCMLAGAKFANIAEPLTRYRVHHEMTSMNIDTARIDRAKDRLYRRLLPMYFPALDGASCERLMTLHHMHRPRGWPLEDMVALHAAAGLAVSHVNCRWGQCAHESREALLMKLNGARALSAEAGFIEPAQFAVLDEIFRTASAGQSLAQETDR